MDFDLFRYNYMILSKANDANSVQLFETAEDLAKNNIRLPDVRRVEHSESRFMDFTNSLFSGWAYGTSYVVWMHEGELQWTVGKY